MNSVCLQTGNFGGNISVADHKTSDETVQNEVATQHSTQPSSHNDNLMTHMGMVHKLTTDGEIFSS